MAKKTHEVWVGPGVLKVGRRTVMPDDPIPAEVSADVRKILRGKGQIVDAVDDSPDLVAIAAEALEAANDAQIESEKAMTELGELSTAAGDAKQALSTAKGANTKAGKAAEAEGASDDDKAAAVEATQALVTAGAIFENAEKAEQKASGEAQVLAETASRLRMESDRATEAAK